MSAAVYFERNGFYAYPGYVYLVKDEGTGLHKVGLTERLRCRVVGLAARSFSLRLVWFIRSNNVAALEREAMHQWAAWRVRGEWFRLPDSAVTSFRAVSLLNWKNIQPVSPAPENILNPIRQGRRPGSSAVVRLGEIVILRSWRHPHRGKGLAR